MSIPFVSVIINNFNYDRFLREAIDSVLDQTYSNFEAIVVDDGSTDKSREIIRSYGDRVVPVLKPNGGQASAFNAGFEQSRGDIICFLDSDDLFESYKVEKIVAALNPAVHGWCFHQLQWIDAMTNPLSSSPESPFRTGEYDLRSEYMRGGSKFWAPATSGLTFTRKLLNKILPMPQDIRITSDNYLKFSALALAPGYFIADRLALQRIHGSNAYTLRSDPSLIANVQISTACGLRQKLPELRPIGNRLFARGLAGKWKAGASMSEVSAELRRYMKDLPWREQAIVLARLAFNAAPNDAAFTRKAAAKA